jgi:hypothetical protein
MLNQFDRTGRERFPLSKIRCLRALTVEQANAVAEPCETSRHGGPGRPAADDRYIKDCWLLHVIRR